MNGSPNINLLFVHLSAGSPFTLPYGFKMASINPASSSTYTITNSLQDLPGITTNASSAVGVPFTFPAGLDPDGWAAHIITCVSGSVDIWYATGQ